MTAQTAPVRNGEPLVSIMTVFQPPTAPQPHTSALLRSAITAHRNRLTITSDTRAQTLQRLVEKVLGTTVDRMTFIPRCHEPVAVVDGLLFRGEAENPYDLKDGWLVVLTKHSGWRDVRSFEHLGEIADREPLAEVQAR